MIEIKKEDRPRYEYVGNLTNEQTTSSKYRLTLKRDWYYPCYIVIQEKQWFFWKTIYRCGTWTSNFEHNMRIAKKALDVLNQNL